MKQVNTMQQIADNQGFVFTEHWTQSTQLFGLTTQQTHSLDPSLVLAPLDKNISERAGNMDNEKVSAKSKPERGL